MSDRDSLQELYAIIDTYADDKNLALTRKALLYIRDNIDKGFDIYFRRRLSICRMLIGLHLTIDEKLLDTILAVTLSNHLSKDAVPADIDGAFSAMYADEPLVGEILAILRPSAYNEKGYYETLIHHPYPLIIRLAERAALLEKLYEWEPADALKFIRETREIFFPMCIYAKENYPEYLGAASVLLEKMRNLSAINEALLLRFTETENAIRDEILSLKEENAVVRAMIKDLS